MISAVITQDRLPPWPDLQPLFDALPLAVSCARMPGAHIQYCNNAFHQLFGRPPGHFLTGEQLIEESCIDEQQREALRRSWRGFALAASGEGITNVTDVEVNIAGADGQIRTARHVGMIDHAQAIALFFYMDITDSTRDCRMLREYAFLDPLTGLANRRGLQERWQAQTIRDPHQRLALLMVDLDGFKPVNDAYGHLIGDAVLCVVAHRLEASVRDTDMVCRLGGDEFVVLLQAPEDFAQVEAVCQRIVASLGEPMDVSNVAIRVTASLGGCFYPDQAADKRELLLRADMAMYQVKKSGQGGWHWWSPALPSLHPKRATDVLDQNASGE